MMYFTALFALFGAKSHLQLHPMFMHAYRVCPVLTLDTRGAYNQVGPCITGLVYYVGASHEGNAEFP